LAVAQVGPSQAEDAVFHISFDGAVSDEEPWAVLGGAPTGARQTLAEGWRPGLSLGQAGELARAVLGSPDADPAGYEVALLGRDAAGRAFARLDALP
jgi:proteasome alpha subunit